MLFELPAYTIAAFPHDAFKHELEAIALDEGTLFDAVVRGDHLVVFVKDLERQTLVSFSFPAEDP